LVRELRRSLSPGQSSASVLESGLLTGPAKHVLEWRCSPYFQHTELYPATDFFERALALRREDSPKERLEKLANYLETLGLPSEIVPLFAALLSIPLDQRFSPPAVGPQRLKEMIQEALLDWLRACSAQQPVLFIVEDLHWIDPSTLEFLGRLVEHGSGESLLSVFTFRPAL